MKHSKLFLGLLSAGIATTAIPLVTLASCNKNPSKPASVLDADDTYVYHQTSGYVRNLEDTVGACYLTGFVLNSGSVSDLTATITNVQGLDESTSVYVQIEPTIEGTNIFNIDVYFSSTTLMALKYVTFDIKLTSKDGKTKTFKEFEVYGFTNTAQLQAKNLAIDQHVGTLKGKNEITFTVDGTFRIFGSEQYSSEHLKKLVITVNDTEGQPMSDVSAKVVVNENDDTFTIQMNIKNLSSQPDELQTYFNFSALDDPLLEGWTAKRHIKFTIAKTKEQMFKCSVSGADVILNNCYCVDDEVVIPDTITIDGQEKQITKINRHAFLKLPLTNLTISDNVKTINPDSVWACENLKKIKFGKNFLPEEHVPSVTNCPNLETIEVSSDNTNCFVKNNALITKSGLLWLGTTKTNTIPSDVQIIGMRSFASSNITNVSIPSSVVEIREQAFSSCANLQTVTFEANSTIKAISQFTFAGCVSLTSINIPNTVETIKPSAFGTCTSLETITLPTNITNIENSAFRMCIKLNNVVLPEGITTLASSAFADCLSLEKINIPASLIDISNGSPFFGCLALQKITVAADNPVFTTDANNTCLIGTYQLEEVEVKILTSITNKFTTVPSNVTIIGKEAFADSAITSIDLANAFIITENAFANCALLETVKFSPYTVFKGHSAFANCSSLEIIDLTNVIDLGTQAFMNCSSLKSVTFGNNSVISEIPYNCFAKCESLVSIKIPDSVIQIQDNAFRECLSLANVEFSNNSKLSTIGGSAFISAAITSITIPETTTKIGEAAFHFCLGLTSATFKNPNNWYQKTKAIDPTTLSDPAQAAQILLEAKELTKKV